MPELRQCEFFLLRYVPDAVKNEFVNVGVVLVEASGDGPAFADVRFTKDWKRVRCLDPDVDLEMLEALEAEIRERLAEGAAGREWLVKRMEDSFSNAIQLSPTKAVLAHSPQEEIARLAQIYLERARRGARPESSRSVIFGRMRHEFERQGVWQFMRKAIPVAEFTHKGDPLKIDAAYRPNGVVRMFHAVSLETDVNLAKVLAFSFPQVREGIAKSEDAKAELTAIVEPELDRDDDAIAFALATLRGHDIGVATVADLPRIAERARRELKI
ncbi:MAG TPA: DUF3037 domain-containing protein [Clostridia bacterium]|nr:DUF3037 domain-containing protein [Clostridia bacterium]